MSELVLGLVGAHWVISTRAGLRWYLGQIEMLSVYESLRFVKDQLKLSILLLDCFGFTILRVLEYSFKLFKVLLQLSLFIGQWNARFPSSLSCRIVLHQSLFEHVKSMLTVFDLFLGEYLLLCYLSLKLAFFQHTLTFLLKRHFFFVPVLWQLLVDLIEWHIAYVMMRDACLVKTCLLLHQRVTKVNCRAIEDNMRVASSRSLLLVKLDITFRVQRKALTSNGTH